MNKKILEMCEKAKYIVKVCKVSPNKCITLFPDRLFGHPRYKGVDLVHEISKNENSYEIRRQDSENSKTFKNIPDYAVRPLIIQDIYLKCGFLGIDNDLVIGYNEKDEVVEPLIHAIPKPESVEFSKEVQTAKMYIRSSIGIDCRKECDSLKIGPGIKLIQNYINESATRFMNEEILD